MRHLEVAAELVCVYEAITARERAGRDVPAFMRALEEKLATEVRWHEELLSIATDLVDVPRMSRSGLPFECGIAELEAKKITAAQAAEILGCTHRHVVRIAKSLEGEQVGGRWLFDEATVKEYRDEAQSG